MTIGRFAAIRSILAVLSMIAVSSLAAPAAAEVSEKTRHGWLGVNPATSQLAQVCAPVGRRVCAFKNGRWRNYRNRCYARRAGARPIRNGQCNVASNCASQGNRPVCGTWRGRRVTFRNVCYARRSNATNLRSGRCQAAGCNDNRPVCGTWRGRRYNFANICQARRRRATNIRWGRCQPVRTCHQRGTSRRFPHLQGRSWHPACRAPVRTCHRSATSRR